MKTAIVVSKIDPAGMNIRDFLEKCDLEKLNAKIYLMEKESIFCEHIDKKIEADLFIFATKHQSEAKVNSLSCHVPGNWAKAEFGGFDRKLCIAPASYLKMALLKLNGLAENLDYEVSMEQTHHGPYLEKPCMFIEIGSSEEQWKDKKAGEIIAKTIIDVLKKPLPKYRIALVLGGGHYNQMANKVVLRTDIAVGHICAKYQLQNLDKEMILQAIEKTKEKVDFVLLDWKGLGKEKQRIVNMLNELNLEFKRTDQIL